MIIDKKSKIYLAGHTGLVGKNLLKNLYNIGYNNLIYEYSSKLDLKKMDDVDKFLNINKPEFVIITAAKHGDIKDNIEKPVEYCYENIMISMNLIHACFKNNIKNMIYIGASCVYPENRNDIFLEEQIFDGPVQKDTEAYALAKGISMKLCEYYNRQYGMNYISLLPVNIYGNDINFNTENLGVIPSLIKRFHMAKINKLDEVFIWGDGLSKRQFINVDDFSKFIIHLMNRDNKYTMYNVSNDEIITINDLAKKVAQIVGYNGIIKNDLGKPNGAKRSMINCDRLKKIGFKPEISLDRGLKEMYSYAIENNLL